MKFKKRFLMVFCSVALLAGMLGGGSVAVTADSETNNTNTVLAIVDGIQKPVVQGMVIAVGKPIVDAGLVSYSFPKILIVASGDESTPHCNVRLYVTEKGEMVVSNISFDDKQNPTEDGPDMKTVTIEESSASASSEDFVGGDSLLMVERHGYAESDLNDFVSMDTCTVRTEIKYYDYGDSVSAHWASWNAWTYFAWWHVVAGPSFNWGPNGPDYVWENCEASFSAYLGVPQRWWTHSQETWFWATPGGGYSIWCYVEGEIFPTMYVDYHGGFIS